MEYSHGQTGGCTMAAGKQVSNMVLENIVLYWEQITILHARQGSLGSGVYIMSNTKKPKLF